jgi:hypothetical protein
VKVGDTLEESTVVLPFRCFAEIRVMVSKVEEGSNL